MEQNDLQASISAAQSADQRSTPAHDPISASQARQGPWPAQTGSAQVAAAQFSAVHARSCRFSL